MDAELTWWCPEMDVPRPLLNSDVLRPMDKELQQCFPSVSGYGEWGGGGRVGGLLVPSTPPSEADHLTEGRKADISQCFPVTHTPIHRGAGAVS